MDFHSHSSYFNMMALFFLYSQIWGEKNYGLSHSLILPTWRLKINLVKKNGDFILWDMSFKLFVNYQLTAVILEMTRVNVQSIKLYDYNHSSDCPETFLWSVFLDHFATCRWCSFPNLFYRLIWFINVVFLISAWSIMSRVYQNWCC